MSFNLFHIFYFWQSCAKIRWCRSLKIVKTRISKTIHLKQVFIMNYIFIIKLRSFFFYPRRMLKNSSMLLFSPLQRLQLQVLAKRYECITAVLRASFGFQLVLELILAFEFLLLGPCRLCELQISRKPWTSSTPQVIWNRPHGCSREAASTFYAPTTYQIVSGAPTFKKIFPFSLSAPESSFYFIFLLFYRF